MNWRDFPTRIRDAYAAAHGGQDFYIAALLILLVLIYTGSVVRELLDVSNRISAVHKSMETAGNVDTPIIAPAISMDRMDSLTLRWFGMASEPLREIIVASPPPRVVEEAPPVDRDHAPQPSSLPFPSVRLVGVFISPEKKETLIEMAGSKQVLTMGQDISGWKLVDILNRSAVFESPDGLKKTLRMFPNSP